MKYTREDVIIWKDDERLRNAKGKPCWLGKSAEAVLEQAQKDLPSYTLEHIHTHGGFVARESCPVYPFIILKKEPEKMIVPFDFSLKEDRDALIGKRIHREWKPTEDSDFFYEEDGIVYTFIKTEQQWICHGYGNAESLFKEYVFADTGKPVGKEIEE